MVTVNSLSGGKTSSYLALHYPADLNIFALVCSECHNINATARAKGILDKKLIQRVNDKLQKYCSHWPEFVGTTEDPIILHTIFDLEQMLGSEIIWLRGMGWESMMDMKQAVPNMSKRFCTSIMKIQPIFEHLYMRYPLPVKMRIGFRYDEKERADSFSDSFRFTRQMVPNKYGEYYHKWEEILWRIGEFPLIEDKIGHYTVHKYFHGKPIRFPDDPNCQNCFWKHPQQLRKNFETNKSIMYWSAIQEDIRKRTFKEGLTLLQIAKIGIQQEFNFGTGAGCQAGFCTD